MIEWMRSDVALRLGYTLLHSLWEGAAVCAAMVLVLWTMRRSTAAARYVVTAVAMVLMMAAPVATFFALRTDGARSSGPHTVPLAIAFPAAVPPQGAESLSGTPVGALPALHDDPALAEAFAPPGRAVRASRQVWLEAHLPYATAAWALGVLLLSLWHLGGWIALQRLRVIGVRPAGSHIEGLLARLARRLGIRHPVRIVESLRIEVPMLLGVWKPLILLPPAMVAGLSVGQLEAILAHELAHVRRHDYLALLLQTFVETVLFYHPGVWWLSRRMRLEREQCCDDLAVAVHGDRREYAGALAAIEALRITATGQPVLAATGAGARELMQRIARLLGIEAPRAPHRIRVAGGAIVVALIVLAALLLSLTPPLLAQSTRPAFTISKETTAITAPILPDGRPDYAGALNAELGKGVTPENNGFVPCLKLMGTDSIRPESRDAILKLCGAPDSGASSFVAFEKFLADHNGGHEPDGSLMETFAGAGRQVWKPADHPELAAYLASQDQALDLLVQAAERPHWWSPYVFETDHNATFLSVPRFVGVVYKCRTLAARATLRAGSGDFDGFRRDVLALKRLSRHLANSGVLIGPLAGTVLDQTANEAIAPVVESGGLSAAQCIQLQQDLAALAPLPAGVISAWGRYQRYLALLEFPQFIGKVVSPSDFGMDARIADQVAGIDASTIDFDTALIAINACFDDLVSRLSAPGMAEMKDRLAARKTMEDGWKADVGNDVSGTKPRPGESRADYSRRIAHWFLTFVAPDRVAGVEEARRQAVLQDEMLVALVAAAQVKATIGHWPDRLETLVPDKLKEIPVDPYSTDERSPVRYQLLDGQPWIFSVGIFSVGAGQDNSRLKIGAAGAAATQPSTAPQ